MRGLPMRTVLAEGEEQGMSATHPLFYAQQRSKYLQRLAQQTQAESQFPTNDLRRNMRVDHYLDQYNNARVEIEKKERIRKSMMRATEFDSIFVDQQQQRRGHERQGRQSRKMQEQLFKNYIQNPQNYQPAERDKPEEGVSVLLEMGGKRQKELWLLDLQIGRLRQQQAIQKRVKDKGESCRNNELLGRLSSSLISSYLVHFDQICGGLIDELLQDEVVFLNNLEAEHRMGETNSKAPSKKTVQMAELVRALDDLCDR